MKIAELLLPEFDNEIIDAQSPRARPRRQQRLIDQKVPQMYGPTADER